MGLEQDLRDRSGESCELCSSKNGLTTFTVAPKDNSSASNCIFVCETCNEQLNNPDQVEPNHWRCLNDSMWSEVDAVKVVSWRMLNQLKKEGWPSDLLDMMYMEDEVLAWAKEGIESTPQGIVHKDSNGVQLHTGDSVVLIKDLDVKGSSLTAKRGAAVRNIRLDPENEEYIEGKVDGQTVVIITKYVKKTN